LKTYSTYGQSRTCFNNLDGQVELRQQGVSGDDFPLINQDLPAHASRGDFILLVPRLHLHQYPAFAGEESREQMHALHLSRWNRTADRFAIQSQMAR
jgi:hypothetical protein